MNKEQQKLYDKLLKKVNEYCLGAAAEDVIAAIDALVENYEDQLDIRYVFIGSRACGKSEEFNRRGRVVNKLKAFQLIIDRRCDIHYIGFFTIINHELEMSKDETKFVEDILNESTN